MDTIDGMRTVVAVIETGSFTAAAERLGLSKSLTSKYVNQVEAQLGVTLFHRTTRKLSVSPPGWHYYRQAQQVLTQFDKLYSQLDAHNQTASGPLRVTASQGFAEELLSPLIPAFHAQYPEIQIDLLVTNQKLDLVEQGIDIAFRASTLDDSGLHYRPLMSLSSAVYAAPELAEQYVDRPAALPCLIDSNLHPTARWPVSNTSQRSRAVKTVFKSNSPRLIRQLTLAGMGASYQPDILAAPYVQRGELQKLDEDFSAMTFPLAALYRGGEYQPERVRVFIGFVAQQFGT
ncbi:LysR family transcriptional regulator [Vibrio coralliilyticus]|uniref:LysR family transcriptional regulator n=1 Tax=Vibrio coralliilyticus TaxID=190893 RepID=UPI002409EC23|nr:LysR family transcriptional regulator [Vibrio coralliilyticus]WFB51055.1 LysR family transcriptional regulator [Vibrio coralliilyticus]